jgi:hypothetical protein
MKSLQRFILLLVLIVSAKIAECQVIPKDIVERVNLSEHIFEGKVILSTSYWNARHDFIYTSITVKIDKIFKGNLTCGTVELILLGGRVGDVSIELDHNLLLSRGSRGPIANSHTQTFTPKQTRISSSHFLTSKVISNLTVTG